MRFLATTSSIVLAVGVAVTVTATVAASAAPVLETASSGGTSLKFVIDGAVKTTGLQCPSLPHPSVLKGGDRTDPRRVRMQELKQMVGRWQTADDGTQFVDIEIVNESGLEKARLVYYEFDLVLDTWKSVVSEKLDYVKNLAVFHLPNQPRGKADVIVSAYVAKGSKNTTFVVSVSRCR